MELNMKDRSMICRSLRPCVGSSAIKAAVLGISHLFRVTAVQHFIDDIIMIRCIIAVIYLLERLPVVNKNLLECRFCDMFVQDESLFCLRFTVRQMSAESNLVLSITRRIAERRN